MSELEQSFETAEKGKPGRDLETRIRHYSNFFLKARDELYDRGTDGICRPKFPATKNESKPPKTAIEEALQNPRPDLTQWDEKDRVFIPEILHCLDCYGASGMTLMAQGYNGWKGAVFKTEFDSTDEPHYVRIGTEDSMHHFNMPWSPLNLQLYSQVVFKRPLDGIIHQFAVERFPNVTMVDFLSEKGSGYPPEGFDLFLNEHILKDTPYKVKMHRDLSILSDGTPVYGDPDSLGFAGEELAERHREDQWDPAWYQKIMKRIHDNCEETGWPEELRWAVETKPGSGVFKTKQEILYPEPLTKHQPQPVQIVPLPPAVT